MVRNGINCTKCKILYVVVGCMYRVIQALCAILQNILEEAYVSPTKRVGVIKYVLHSYRFAVLLTSLTFKTFVQ